MNVRCGRTRLIAAAAVLAVLCVVPARAAEPADQDTPSKGALQKMYMSYLSDEGYKPEIDPDGDIRYKAEGKTYCIIIDEKDPRYFRLVLANIWKIESEGERRKVLVAVDYSNAQTKVSKSYTLNDNVWVCVELFVTKPEDFKPLFSRSSAALARGLANFLKKMQE
jgi:hypothetical protein